MTSTTRRLRAMAMAFDVTLDGLASEAAATSAIDAVHRELMRADDLFSLFRPDTPMSALATGAAGLEDMPDEVLEVLRLCEAYRHATGGAFDIKRADGVLDPTGVVKTWAVSQAATRLGNVPSWLIAASGDVLAHGGERRVGIADPAVKGDPAGSKVLDVVTIGGAFTAVATSGSAQVADHIWDPVTGKPARHFVQASVAGNDIVECDAWATAICAGGAPVVERAAAAGLEVLIVTSGRSQGGYEAVSTPGWPRAS
ncbi:FAD:protein FMN transferase [Demequina sp.]|uniref:FAD:protein FMN transferase n=1 Tax=Demequina sp. TaxID=2050685 RepID=UPI003D0A4E61